MDRFIYMLLSRDMEILLIPMNVNLIQHNMFSQKANVIKFLLLNQKKIFLMFLGLNKYKKKVYKKTKNLLTGSTEQDEEYQKVSFD